MQSKTRLNSVASADRIGLELALQGTGALIVGRLLRKMRACAKLTLQGLAGVTILGTALAQSGLTSRQPIASFLNGKMPQSAPGVSYKATDAFPQLRFPNPIKMVQRPGTNQMWVIGQDGYVWSFDKNSPGTKSVVLDISAVTVGHDDGEGDSGLVGIAFHPQFGQAGSPNRGYVYLFYSYRPAGNGWGTLSYDRLSRFTLADGASQIDAASEQVLINQFDRKTWHTGGDMFFGADGFLYVTVGDEGPGIAGAEQSNSQKINAGLFSGVLRIDVDKDGTRSHAIRRQPEGSGAPPAGWPSTYTQNYYVPNDNPWVAADGSALEEFYAIGLRSPHRMSRDAVSGAALISDTGSDSVEEINVLAKGANFQWAYLEGSLPGVITNRRGPGTDTPPLFQYSERAVDGSAVIGGYVYRGAANNADLGGKYIFGDYISGKVWALSWQDSGTPRRELVTVPNGTDYRGLSGFSVDSSGEIYMMVLGSEGRIFRLDAVTTGGQPPATLSATGAFTNLASLATADGIIPFSVNAPLWSDGALKTRWIALPNNGAPFTADEVVSYSTSGEWSFPVGTVVIKHFELAVSDANPALRKRLETRFLVHGTAGWYGLAYRWRDDGSDADLLSGRATADITIAQTNGTTRTQQWTFPSREDCTTCHTANTSGPLSLKTAQLNGSHTYSSGVTANQLATWSAIGMFDTTLSSTQITAAPKMVALTDTTASLEARMRSYFDSNCAHCHRPEGVWRSDLDARFSTPLVQQGIVNGTVENDFGIPGARTIVPGDPDKSLIYIRLAATDHTKMPPLGRSLTDPTAVDTLRQWITELATGTPGLQGLDIGAVSAPGSTSYDAGTGTYTITNSGRNIWGTDDAFHFASTTLNGDGEIRARVASETNTNEWAKAGVMIRETLDAGSRHVLMYTTPVESGNGYEMLWREAKDDISGSLQGPPSNPAPNNWVRLVRVGDSITGYVSADGSAWTLMTTMTLPGLPASLKIGLAVSSANTSATSTATFDNVSIIGSVAGSQAAHLVSPVSGTTLTSATTTLTWDRGIGATQYALWVGSNVNGYDLYAALEGTNTTRTVTLPDDGRTIYVTVWSLINGTYQSSQHTLTAYNAPPPVKARLTSPANGSVLGSTALDLQWDAGVGVTSYYLFVGRTPQGYDIYSGDQGTARSRTVTVPADGKLYVTLWSLIKGTYQPNSYVFTAPAAVKAAFTGPADGTRLAGTSLSLNWSTGTGVSHYVIWVGSAPGSYDLGAYDEETRTDGTINVPADGGPVYLTLWSLINGAWQSASRWFYTDEIDTKSRPARLTSPSNTSTLASTDVTFEWDAGLEVTDYAMWIGSTPSGYDLYAALEGDARSRTVTLPGDGRRVYVTLWSHINGQWQSNGWWFTAATGPAPEAARLHSPESGTTLDDASLPLSWDAGSGASQYALWVGTMPNDYDIHASLEGDSRSRTITVPTDGSVVYVTLWSLIGDSWQSNTYFFKTANLDAHGKKARLTSHANDSQLPGADVTFAWDSGIDVDGCAMWIGSSPRSYDLYAAVEAVGGSRSVTLPADGRKIHVTLWSLIGGEYRASCYQFTATNVPAVKAALTSHATGGTLGGASATLTWSAGTRVSQYALWIGTKPDGYDLYAAVEGTSVSRVISGLPTDGSPLYVTLWSFIDGAWQRNDYILNAYGAP